ncbi:MAG: type II secretion system protein GspE, partial [Actinobacteria bacterium]|nr:type II secretion system protein GspE [Actinomycetota bacterium]
MSQAITDVLVTEGVISAEQLAEAEELVTVRGEPVLTVLIEQGAIARRDVVRYTVQAAGMEFVEIMDAPVDQEAVGMITGDQARRFGVIPIRIEGDDLVVVADSQTAMNWQIKDDLQTITKKNIKFACSIKSEIDSRINMLYRAEAELGSLMKDIMDEEPTVDVLAPVEDSSDAPLVKYVNLLLGQAISDKASDIHVEPNENHVRVRFRIDGVLK